MGTTQDEAILDRLCFLKRFNTGAMSFLPTSETSGFDHAIARV